MIIFMVTLPYSVTSGVINIPAFPFQSACLQRIVFILLRNKTLRKCFTRVGLIFAAHTHRYPPQGCPNSSIAWLTMPSISSFTETISVTRGTLLPAKITALSRSPIEALHKAFAMQ